MVTFTKKFLNLGELIRKYGTPELKQLGKFPNGKE